MKYLLKIDTVRVLVGVAAMFTLMLVACGGADTASHSYRGGYRDTVAERSNVCSGQYYFSCP